VRKQLHMSLGLIVNTNRERALGSTNAKKTHVNDIKERFFCPVVLWPNSGYGLLIHEVSRSHSDAPQPVGLLWASDQPVAETST
jgi:hypothetical protein